MQNPKAFKKWAVVKPLYNYRYTKPTTAHVPISGRLGTSSLTILAQAVTIHPGTPQQISRSRREKTLSLIENEHMPKHHMMFW